MPNKWDVMLDFDYKGSVVALVMLCSLRASAQVAKSGLTKVLKRQQGRSLSDSADLFLAASLYT